MLPLGIFQGMSMLYYLFNADFLPWFSLLEVIKIWDGETSHRVMKNLPRSL